MSINLKKVKSIIMGTEMMVDNTASEPRDILMIERTALSWAKFSITLSAIAVTIATDFRLDTSSSNFGKLPKLKNPPPWFPRFSYAVSILFVILSMLSLFVGLLSYVQSIYNYKSHRVFTYSLRTSMGYLLVVGVLLLAINITFLIAVKE